MSSGDFFNKINLIGLGEHLYKKKFGKTLKFAKIHALVI